MMKVHEGERRNSLLAFIQIKQQHTWHTLPMCLLTFNVVALSQERWAMKRERDEAAHFALSKETEWKDSSSSSSEARVVHVVRPVARSQLSSSGPPTCACIPPTWGSPLWIILHPPSILLLLPYKKFFVIERKMEHLETERKISVSHFFFV